MAMVREEGSRSMGVSWGKHGLLGEERALLGADALAECGCSGNVSPPQRGATLHPTGWELPCR